MFIKRPTSHFRLRQLWQYERDQSQRNRSKEGFELYLASLPLHLCELRFVVDQLHAFIHMTRSSRGQAQAGLIVPLEEANRRAPEAQEQWEPPPAVDTPHNERREDDQADHRLDHAGDQPAAPFACTDIGDANLPHLSVCSGNR